jgi:hypothetical protein
MFVSVEYRCIERSGFHLLKFGGVVFAKTNIELGLSNCKLELRNLMVVVLKWVH